MSDYPCCSICGQRMEPRCEQRNPPPDWIGTVYYACPTHGAVGWGNCLEVVDPKLECTRPTRTRCIAAETRDHTIGVELHGETWCRWTWPALTGPNQQGPRSADNGEDARDVLREWREAERAAGQ